MRRTAKILCCAITLASALPAVALAAGATNYASRCSMCHQPSGAGLPGQFPRLSGRAAQMAGSPDGRAYLAKVLLFGLYGPINVDGKPITGMMPAVGSMNDQDIADLLNHLVSLKKAAKPAAAFTAAEVAKVRAQGKLTSSGVATVRTDLASKGIVP
jgi:mono/diheme cytochrome c family protein